MAPCKHKAILRVYRLLICCYAKQVLQYRVQSTVCTHFWLWVAAFNVILYPVFPIRGTRKKRCSLRYCGWGQKESFFIQLPWTRNETAIQKSPSKESHLQSVYVHWWHFRCVCTKTLSGMKEGWRAFGVPKLKIFWNLVTIVPSSDLK